MDEVVIDLEDAVPVAQKTDETRLQAADAIARLPWRAPTVAVRVNGLGTPWFRDDIAAIVQRAGPRLASIVLPKVESAEAVGDAVLAVDAAGPLGAALGFEALIESALGVVRVESIAESTPRLEALIFGPGDYAASLGLPMARHRGNRSVLRGRPVGVSAGADRGRGPCVRARWDRRAVRPGP